MGGEVVLGWVPAQEGLSDLKLLVMPTPEPSPAHQSPTLRLSFKELQICVIEKKKKHAHHCTFGKSRAAERDEIAHNSAPMTSSVDI